MAVATESAPLQYATVAAGQTGAALSSGGAKGDFLSHVTIIPATTSPGVVTLIDGATSIALFAGGATSVTSLLPHTVQVGANSKNGPWTITTGSNVSIIAYGRFG